MSEDISEDVKKEIFRLVCVPGIEIEEISEIVNKDYNTQLDHEKVMEILSEEYLKHDLDFGRRLCCRF